MTTIEDVLSVQMYRANLPHELFSYVDGFLLIIVIETPTPRLRGMASVRWVDSCSQSGGNHLRGCAFWWIFIMENELPANTSTISAGHFDLPLSVFLSESDGVPASPSTFSAMSFGGAQSIKGMMY